MATLLSGRSKSRTSGGTQPVTPTVKDIREYTGELDTSFRSGRPVGAGLLALPAQPHYSRSSGYVRGVSLSGILQMLHLERKTCLLEVTSGRHQGAMTLVNGELVDAECEQLTGENAVYEILSWDDAQTAIMEGVSLFRHSVAIPISKLLLESACRMDEASGSEVDTTPFEAQSEEEAEAPAERTDRPSDWEWLAETLIISGASVSAIVRADDEHVIAAANETGGSGVSSPARELASIARGVRAWSRSMKPPIDEFVLKIAGRQVLISPLDNEHDLFACAMVDGAESLDLARGAIRTLNR